MGWLTARRAEFSQSLPGDLPRSRNAQRGHYHRHGSIRPARPAAEHPDRSEQHGEVADHVIARAQPDRAHVRLAASVSVEHGRDRAVGNERSNAYRAHQLGMRNGAGDSMPSGADEYANAEDAHCRALDQRRASAPRQRQTSNGEADRVIRSVGEEVESIRLERAGAGENAAADLDREHGEVDRQREPENDSKSTAIRRFRIAVATGHCSSAFFGLSGFGLAIRFRFSSKYIIAT